MTNQIERPQAEDQPHAIADIFGRLQKHLKHGERLQFMTNEELKFLNKNFAHNPFGIQYAKHTDWPAGFKHLHVYSVWVGNAEGGKHVPGVLQTFGQYHVSGPLFAVVDCGEHGVVHRSPHALTQLTREASDKFAELWQRRQGRRVVRAMRDIGSVPGQEDILLLNIIQGMNLYRRFMDHIEARFGVMGSRAIFDGLRYTQANSELNVSSSFAVSTTREVVMPNRHLIGERCVHLLMDAGIPPGNLYHGMHEMLREVISRRKTVNLLDPHMVTRHSAIMEAYRLEQSKKVEE
ncbi:hypothetical protein CNR33_00083 [Pseudomonas phage tabernarius]|uniref:Uncharacterized protein n=1 Tax=Pseudomonas phage tabernarius TaxID=2048978 RepID=A0A2H4P6X1_9CAUD|nr:hypothetical protein FDJ17_gp83 [Pseudomonas phage tabernarius]ATW57929.1 hypothetical protein CNR33_00083 [Pseudomonas phage tabernarius]